MKRPPTPARYTERAMRRDEEAAAIERFIAAKGIQRLAGIDLADASEINVRFAKRSTLHGKGICPRLGKK